MPTNITSHNQSGGITAKTVQQSTNNAQENISVEKKLSKKKLKIWAFILGVIGLIASVLTIIDHYHIKL